MKIVGGTYYKVSGPAVYATVLEDHYVGSSKMLAIQFDVAQYSKNRRFVSTKKTKL